MNNLEAVEAAITETGLARLDRYAPLLELCRVLARQMDGAGDAPSTRLSAAYLSALKDLGRAVQAMPATPREVSRVARLRALHGVTDEPA